MKLNNFKSVYGEANTLYGVTMDSTLFEDIALNGWELIGNKNTKLYRYTTGTEDKKIKIPCNVEHIEAVFCPREAAQITHPYSNYADVYNQWIEEYVASWKNNHNLFYERGSLVKYKEEGEYLVFDRDYPLLTILYKGIIADDEGLPYLSNREVRALAAYVAYADCYRKALINKDGNLLQLAAAIKNDWLKLCMHARIPEHLSQNDMNDILDVKTRWDRKSYGKAFKVLR